MADTNQLLETALNDYIKKGYTQEECSGFIDGFNKAQELNKHLPIPGLWTCK